MTTAPAHSASPVPARGPQRQAGTGAPILGRVVAGVASPQPLAPSPCFRFTSSLLHSPTVPCSQFLVHCSLPSLCSKSHWTQKSPQFGVQSHENRSLARFFLRSVRALRGFGVTPGGGVRSGGIRRGAPCPSCSSLHGAARPGQCRWWPRPGSFVFR